MAATETKSATALLEKMAAQMEEMAKPKSLAGGTPAALFGGVYRDRSRDYGDGGWDKKTLDRLSKAYGNQTEAVHKLMAGRGNLGGKARGCGMGPALAKMQQMAYPDRFPGAEGYNNDKFKEEFGFVSWHEATTKGIAQPNGMVVKTALAEGSGTTGGYIVPPDFHNELLTIADEDAFIEPRAKVVPMTTRTMEFPVLDITSDYAPGITPYYGGIQGYWQPEAQLIQESEPQFKLTEWTAWDLMLYAVSSNQLLADNGIGLDALLTSLFAEAMVWYSEYAYLQGQGAGSKMPLGVLNAPATIFIPRNTSSKFQFPDVANMVAHLQVRSWDSACWIMHQSVLPQLMQMTDVAGGGAGSHLVWLNVAPSGEVGPLALKAPKALFFGLPIFFTDKLPQLGTTGDVMLVDWSRYLIGQRMELQIAVSGEYLFRNNQLAWRVICRKDGKPFLSSAIVDPSGWTISPFVCLQ